jgi:hypothetical protein
VDAELWKLKKENAELRKSLAQAQLQVLQAFFDKADADSRSLGDKFNEATENVDAANAPTHPV